MFHPLLTLWTGLGVLKLSAGKRQRKYSGQEAYAETTEKYIAQSADKFCEVYISVVSENFCREISPQGRKGEQNICTKVILWSWQEEP